eukprot:scaffold126_cov315-Pavlova_lutheri.AAC.5
MPRAMYALRPTRKRLCTRTSARNQAGSFFSFPFPFLSALRSPSTTTVMYASSASTVGVGLWTSGISPVVGSAFPISHPSPRSPSNTYVETASSIWSYAVLARSIAHSIAMAALSRSPLFRSMRRGGSIPPRGGEVLEGPGVAMGLGHPPDPRLCGTRIPPATRPERTRGSPPCGTVPRRGGTAFPPLRDGVGDERGGEPGRKGTRSRSSCRVKPSGTRDRWTQGAHGGRAMADEWRRQAEDAAEQGVDSAVKVVRRGREAAEDVQKTAEVGS